MSQIPSSYTIQAEAHSVRNLAQGLVDKDGRPTKKGIILYLQDRQRRGLDLDEPVSTNGHQLPPPALPRNDLRGNHANHCRTWRPHH